MQLEEDQEKEEPVDSSIEERANKTNVNVLTSIGSSIMNMFTSKEN